MKQRPSIKNRVRAVILFASVIVLLVTTATFAVYEVVSFKDQMERDLTTLGDVIADNAAIPLAFGDARTGQAILATLKADPDIVAAVLFDLQGSILATYPSSVPIEFLPDQIGEEGHKFTPRSLEVFKRAVHEQKQTGTLYLRSSLLGLHQRFWRYGTIVATVLIGSLIMAFLLSTFLQKRISDPILALTQAAQAVSERADYSVRAPKVTEDELGTLTDAFNRMLVETQEHQSRLSEQARLLDLSTDAIIVRDGRGIILYWNRGAEELYGWTRAEALGKSKAELLRTEFPEPPEKINDQLHQDNRWSGELVQTRRDGARIVVATRWAMDRNRQGEAMQVLIIDNDITAGKQAEELLRESERRFRLLADSAPVLIWVNDNEGCEFVNRQYLEFLGVTVRDVKHYDWVRFVHADDRENYMSAYLAAVNRRRPFEAQFRFRRHDGEYRWMKASGHPRLGPDGELIGYVGITADISDVVEAQHILRQRHNELERLVAERTAKLHETIGELEAFSYSISHDMRSPLRAMQGFADALLEDYQERLDAKGRDYLERIARASKRLDSLIQDVLAYSRLAKGEIGLQPVNLERLIDEILPDHPEFQSARATIEVKKPLHRVMGHEAYLTQCITNLLGNAVKFVPPGTHPHVRIRSEAFEDKVRIWFEDNGIGIAPEHFERIFQIFGQVHGGKQYGGTGIGLAIVRKAAQRMGGGAGVESELGKGSRFWLLLNAANYDDAPRDTVGGGQ